MEQICVGMVSLGCSKNQVDGEVMMADLERQGFRVAEEAGLADVAIVNTCGFIDNAKKEAVAEILELAKLKEEGKIQKIVVTGCMAQRYQQEIRKELPEVDAVVGIGGNHLIGDVIREMMARGYSELFPDKENLWISGERRITGPKHSAYLKIAEGCDHRCSYCAIPMIRGRYRSRSITDIEREAQKLVEAGARELVLIAQDSSYYGMDIYGIASLPRLLKRLCKVEGLVWLRLLYCYPDAMTEELLETIAREEKIVKYLDIPLQHASGRILRAMHRTGDRASLEALIRKIREKIPGVTLRTTFITGFPGETQEEFGELEEFIREMRFERMGCFAYSQEEGTPAAALPDQLEEEEKLRRSELLTEIQMGIQEEQGAAMLGKEIPVLVEGFDRYADCWFGRSPMDAPDIDGKVFFTAPDEQPQVGAFVRVLATQCVEGDLMGQMLPAAPPAP